MTEPSSLLQGLNTEQLWAVTYPAESVLILAGAGSGKTRVLTTRIAWLLHNNMVKTHGILAVTFTNKAAKEMRLRLSAMLPFSIQSMWLGTFHGLCHRLLRQHHKEVQLPASFQIIDTADQLALIKRLLKALNVDEKLFAPRNVQGFINAQKEAGLRANDIAGQVQEHDFYTKKLVEYYALYDSQCRREGLVDFAELLLRSYELLRTNQALRTHYQKRFTHILVDEFQDTNTLQYAWLKLLSSEHTAMFAVGDDDQSIYRFRGANVGNMRQLLADFHITEPIKLEQNYRSSGHILQAANALIAHNLGRLGKNLHTSAPDGEKIRFIQAASDSLEAEEIVSQIQHRISTGTPADNIAILYRSNAQSRVLEQALFQAAIPYKIYGGLRFYERQEVKHVLAYLRLLVNQQDDNALLRIINMPPRGIGARSVENIQATAKSAQISLFAACRQWAVKNEKIRQFVALIDGMSDYLHNDNLGELVRDIIEQSRLPEYYRQQKQSQQDRLDNLDELIHAATLYRAEDNPIMNADADEQSPDSALISFLNTAALEAGEHQTEQGAAVQLMTVHAAKGLEFQIVFVSGLEEGLFPSEYSLSEEGGLEEERRLMYVAITRARAQLYLSAAAQRMLHGHLNFPIPSRFINEIPPETIHYFNPKHQPIATHTAMMPAEPVDNVDNTASFAGFAVGDNVRHRKFGTGVIIDASAKGDGARLTVNFGKEGVKELDSRFANLDRL